MSAIENTNALSSESLLASQRCLILGGSGFIGTNLCLALRGHVRRLRVFSKSSQPPIDVEWFKGDFLSDDDLRAALDGIDIVFHLVSTNTPASSNDNPLADAQQNILQSVKLLDFCCAAKVKRVVFVSSGGTIYGNAPVPTTELDHPSPICAYGVSKLAIESYLALYERLHGIVGISLRVSNPYGPFQVGNRNQGIIGTFLRKWFSGQSVEIWGDGEIVRDYVFIDDIVNALVKTIGYQGNHRLFNIGSGVGTSLNEIVAVLNANLKTPLNVDYKPARLVDVQRSVLDCSLAKNELCWTPEYNLMNGVAKTVSWFEQSRRD